MKVKFLNYEVETFHGKGKKELHMCELLISEYKEYKHKYSYSKDPDIIFTCIQLLNGIMFYLQYLYENFILNIQQVSDIIKSL